MYGLSLFLGAYPQSLMYSLLLGATTKQEMKVFLLQIILHSILKLLVVKLKLIRNKLDAINCQLTLSLTFWKTRKIRNCTMKMKCECVYTVYFIFLA